MAFMFVGTLMLDDRCRLVNEAIYVLLLHLRVGNMCLAGNLIVGFNRRFHLGSQLMEGSSVDLSMTPLASRR